MSVQTTERAIITMDLEMKFDFYVVSDEITIYSLKLTVLARPPLDRHTGVKT